ncbi:MAG: M28 family peptidase [Lachnospiraceae bacterium]|nr:M28 family peptidase [Lachnospiraceae bacterium]
MKSFNVNYNDVTEMIDVNYAFQITKELAGFEFRLAGTEAENKAADWIVEQMEKVGLKNVTKEGFPVDAWNFHRASVEILNPDNENLKMDAVTMIPMEGTAEEGIEGEVVYVGYGTKKEYEGKDVKDKIVLMETSAFTSYWYQVVFNQAEARGAKGIILTVYGVGPGTYKDDLLTIQDLEGECSIPAAMISKGNGEKLIGLLKEKSIKANIKINASVDRDATGHFVYGLIPGRRKDKYLLLNGHYDAYWQGFQDNAASLGCELAIAKAVMESGYEPECTWIIISNGAEEFGTINSYFDWMVGAMAIAEHHPEWVANCMLFNNFELSGLSQNKKMKFACSESYMKYLDKIMNDEIKLPKEQFPEGHIIKPLFTGSDHFVLSLAGAPSLLYDPASIELEDNPDQFLHYYHTSYDNEKTAEMNFFENNCKIECALCMIFDKLPMSPFDFSKDIEGVMSGIVGSEYIESIYPNYTKFCSKMEEYRVNTENLYNKIGEVIDAVKETVDLDTNEETMSEIYDMAWNENVKLLQINKEMCERLYKVDGFHEHMVAHKQAYEYVDGIERALADLRKNKAEDGVDALLGVGHNYLVEEFDEYVYKMALKPFLAEEYPRNWAEGRIMPHSDMYDVLKSIIDKRELKTSDYALEIVQLEKFLNFQKDVLCDSLNEELELFGKINRDIKLVNVDSVIERISEVLKK